MSWVKKFQEGGKSTKQYGHLIINGIDLGNSEEMYNAFARHAQRQDIKQGKFYDQWLEMLRNGEDVEFGNGNTVNAKPNDMSEHRAGERSNWTRFWDDVFDTDRNQFSNAVATARKFNWAPLRTEETPVSKKDFDTSEIILNYNEDPKKKGHRIWSTGHADNQRAIQRVSDAIAGLKDPDNSDYTFNDSLKAAYQIAVNSGMTPEEYAQAIWSRLQDNSWTGYKNPENNNDLDWLRAFGIGVGPYTASEQSITTAATPVVTPANPVSDGKDKQIDELKEQLAALQNPQGNENTQTQQNEEPQVVIYHSIPGTKVTATDPDADGWRTYNFTVVPGHYQYNTNVNVSTARPSEQPRAEMTNDDRLSMVAKMIGENPLVYNNISYPIVQEKDTDRYFALTNNGRLQLDQDFVVRWLENKLTEDDNKKMSLWPGQKAKTTNDKGEKLNWIGKIWARLNGPDAYIDVSEQARQDRISAYKSKQKSGAESQLARAKANYERSLSAGGSKDPSKNKYAKEYLELLQKMQKNETGGKIDFNKVNAFKKGGKVAKAQNGLSALDGALLQQINHLKSNDFIVRDVNGNYKWFSDNFPDMLTYVPESTNPNTGIKSEVDKSSSNLGNTSANNIQESNKSRYSDYNFDSSPYITAGINAGLAALDYGSMAWGRRKIHDITERAIKDSIYKQTVPQLQTLPVTTPLEDRLAKMYESHIGRMKLPQTSDAVTNTSLEFTDDAQAMQGLSQAVGQQSAKVTQLQQANQQTLNQQQQYYANAENDLRQRVAGAIMNLGQNDASLVAQTAQSIQNLAREWRTKFDNANQQFNLFQYQNKINELNRQSEADWLNQVQTAHPDIWAQWDAADQSKYDNDFNTWAMSQKGVWNQLENDYRANQEAINTAAGNAYLDYRLKDPFLRSLYRNRYAVARKSGGKITTKRQNRYKNEPSEDIWIEQNKSTHKLVAKLNDNIIKTFLKTLK